MTSQLPSSHKNVLGALASILGARNDVVAYNFQDASYNLQTLQQFALALGLDDTVCAAFTPLLAPTPTPNPNLNSNPLLSPFLSPIPPPQLRRIFVFAIVRLTIMCDHGYDARTRSVLKSLALAIFNNDNPLVHFESIENHLTKRIMLASRQHAKSTTLQSTTGWVRTAKIGLTGLGATTVFALTGGLAAPAIAAGMAAVLGTTGTIAGVTAAVTFLTSTSVFTALFGAAGGGLATWKMSKRTAGVREFEFESHSTSTGTKLISTICISGWLRDKHDFVRPWGVVNLKGATRLEKLERFYMVHKRENVKNSRNILKKWNGFEENLWGELKTIYGEDPDCLSLSLGFVIPAADSPCCCCCFFGLGLRSLSLKNTTPNLLVSSEAGVEVVEDA